MNPEAETRRWTELEKLLQVEHDWELRNKNAEAVSFYRTMLQVIIMYKDLNSDGTVTWKEMLQFREQMEESIERFIPNIKTLIR